jgi:hypothetical protein
MDEPRLVLLLIVWLACLVAIAMMRFRQGAHGTGLVFAYLVNLWFAHWLGAAIYLFPWYNMQDWRVVQSGFEQSVYAVLALAAGSVVLAPILLSLWPPRHSARVWEPDPKLARTYLVVGATAYAALSTVLGQLPTVGSLLAAAQQLLVVGLCLICWHAWHRGRIGRLVGWLLATSLLPFATIVFTGFLGYGAVAALVIYLFVGSFVRPRWKVGVGFLILAYLGLSFYVSYMRDRSNIRDVVWGGRPLDERVEQVLQTITDIDWFDPTSEAHLWQLDRRLNQNYFIGLAEERLARGDGAYAYGATIVDSVLGVIPRAVWPEKPILAGSGDLVARYTGVRFAEGTSVGIGQVMELYVNFGTTGIVVGFLVIGTLLPIVDRWACEALEREDWRHFALWFLPGVAMLQVGGAFVEVTGTAAASIVATLAVNRFLRHGLLHDHWDAPPRLSRSVES